MTKSKIPLTAGKLFILAILLLVGMPAFAQDTAWTRMYGLSGHEEAHCVKQTTDGGYVLAGWTTSVGPEPYNFYVVKTDSEGDTLWTRTYRGNDLQKANSITQTGDGGYVICGWTQYYISPYLFNRIYLVKINAVGDTVWTRKIGVAQRDDFAFDIQQTADGGFIIAGQSGWWQYLTWHMSVCLVKTDSEGNVVWKRTYEGSIRNECYSVKQTSDGGYICAGSTHPPSGDNDIYVIKTNSEGNIIWDTTYGGSSDEVAHSIDQTTDGGYIIAGYTASYGAGFADYYLVRTNQNGDTLWTRTYGGSAWDRAYSMVQTEESVFALAGVSDSEIWLVCTDSLGDTLWTNTYGPGVIYSIDQTDDMGYVLAGSKDGDFYLIKVQGIQPQVGSIAGNVTDAYSLQPIENALVEAMQGTEVIGTDYTNSLGEYEIPDLLPGSYDVRASKFGYERQTQYGVIVQADQTTVVDFELVPSPTANVWGFVYDGSTMSGLGGVLVEFLQDDVIRYSTITWETPAGLYELWGIFAGTYDVRYSKAGYYTEVLEQTIIPGENPLQTVTLCPVGYVSSQPLTDAIEDLNTAVGNYLWDNSLLAHDANWTAYLKMSQADPDISDYWIEVLEAFLPGASHQVNVGRVEKMLQEKFSSSQYGFLLLVEKVVFELQKLNMNLMLAELLSKAISGDPLSLDYFRNEAVIDGDNLTVQDAMDGLTVPTLPEYLAPDFPLDRVIERIDNVIEDLEAVTFCCPATVKGKFERGGIWCMPGQCDLSKVQNYTVGSDIQQAMRYYVALDKMVDSDKWETFHELMCSGEASGLAYYAKFLSLVAGVGLLAAGGTGLPILGFGEAIYTAYSGSCTGVGYNALAVKYDKTTKMAHSLSEYNSSWPDALMSALELRNKIVEDILDVINNPSQPECSKNWYIVSTDVPDVVCADFLNQFVDVDARITIENRDNVNGGTAKVFTSLYAVGKNGRLNHVRTDSSQTVYVEPSGMHQFSVLLKVTANALLLENDRYKLFFKVIVPDQILTVSRSFQCLYDYQCNIQDYLDHSAEVISGFIEETGNAISGFVSGLGAKFNEFTLSWPGSDLNLHIYDALGNHVGYNDSTGMIEIEIPGASYSGPNSCPEIIIIPDPVDSYVVRVEGVDVIDSTYFYVEAYEIFEHVPVLLPITPSLDLVGMPGDSVDFSVGLQEAGGQSAATGITASITPLVSASEDTISNVYLSLPFNEIPADTFYYGNGYVKTDTLDLTGDYAGIINVSFDGGSFEIPMFLSLVYPYVSGDANGDGLIDIADVVYLINYLFISGPTPVPLEAGDANCDGVVDIADVVYLINYLFIDGPPPLGC